MSSINFSEIFPTKGSSLIFIVYMSLFIGQGLLVTKSQESNNSYQYNTVLAVLITEVVKFLICIIAYCMKNSWSLLLDQTLKNIKLVWLYFIPAFLYCLYNNLAYVNLLSYDPATYSILLQIRVVITGILFQVLFKKMLTSTQWSSLILLTVGCMVKNINFNQTPPKLNYMTANNVTTHGSKHDGLDFNFSTGLILLQVISSCFAGVYIEFLIKSRGLNVDVFIQNTFLYMDSIVCNAIVLCLWWNPNTFSNKTFTSFLDSKVLIVVLNNAACGIVTSYFLKYLNSILKTIASALELVFISVLTWLFFGVPITYQTVLSIGIVSAAIFLYTQNPVKSIPDDVPLKKLSTESV